MSTARITAFGGLMLVTFLYIAIRVLYVAATVSPPNDGEFTSAVPGVLSVDLGVARPNEVVKQQMWLPLPVNAATRIIDVGRTCGCITATVSPTVAPTGTSHLLAFELQAGPIPADSRQKLAIRYEDEKTGAIDRLVVNVTLRVRESVTVKPIVKEMLLTSFGESVDATLHVATYFDTRVDAETLCCKADVPWIRIESAVDETAINEGVKLVVTADPSNLGFGRHFGLVTISTAHHHAQRQVVLNYKPPMRVVPAVGLLQPATKTKNKIGKRLVSEHKLFVNSQLYEQNIFPHDFEIEIMQSDRVQGGVVAGEGYFRLQFSADPQHAAPKKVTARIRNSKLTKQWHEIEIYSSVNENESSIDRKGLPSGD